jgi:Leucine-rich repeat (LRR) protein
MLTVTPAANQTGSATVTLSVTDPAGLSSSAQIQVTVEPDIFADTNLERAVRWTLGGSTDPISSSDLAKLTSLTAEYSWYYGAVTNLGGLQLASNLGYLDLYGNRIADLSPLAGLSNLYYLDLRYNALTNIDVLGNLPKLQTVYLDGNWLDMSPNSAALTVIQTLQGRGVSVSYQFQNTNQPPSIWMQTSALTVAANGTAQISLSVWDDYTPANSLVLSATSSNPSLLPDGAITIANNNYGSRTLTVAPAASQTGTATVTLSVTDGFNATTQTNISVTVMAATNVVFCDPLLEQAVRDALSKQNGDLTTVDMLNLTSLRYQGYYWGYYWSSQVTNLCGLEYAVNLRNLELPGNNVSDLQPLSGLTQLESLDLQGNPVTNTAPLAGLTNLSRVDLTGVAILCDGLSGLANVKNLILDGNYSVLDASCLTNLTSVTNLSLASCIMTNLSALGSLPNLQFLDLENRWNANCQDLIGLTNIITLNLQNNSLTNLSGLGSLYNLQSLDLSYNLATNLSPLAGLTNLTSLLLQNNWAADLDTLPALPELSYLNLHQSQFSDLNSLAALTNLTNVVVSNNRLTNIDGLRNLPQLRQVDLSYNLLDLSQGSTAASVIQSLQSRGVSVFYPYQRVAPYLWSQGPVTIESGRTASIGISVNDDVFSPWDITLTASSSSSNTQLIPDAGLNFNYTTLNITPASGQTGTSTITIVATDPAGLSATNSFLLTVVPVLISDTNLEAVVRNALGYRIGSQAITRDVLTNLTYLSANYSAISNLSGLEFATNLNSLYLNSNGITNIAQLAALTSLQYLSLSYNQVTDCSPLSGLVDLTSLDLSSNPLTNCSALAGLTQLTSLNLSYTHISDLSPLAGMVWLTDLNIGGNPVQDLSPLTGLTNLVNLTLYSTWVTNIDALLGLPHLVSVNVSGCLLDLSPGSPASNVLASLQARGVVVSSYWQLAPPVWHVASPVTIAANHSSPLGFWVYDQVSPANLSFAASSSNPALIPDIGIAIDATNSRITLTPAPNQTGDTLITLSATDEAGLSASTNVLVTVRMATNVFFADIGLETAVRHTLQKPVGAITTVDMQNLASLDASLWSTGYRAVSNLAGLEFAINLNYLSLRYASVSDFSVLSNLTAVTNLDLSGTPVNDLTPLLGLTNLISLGLAQTGITNCLDVSPFNQLTSLTLDNNPLTNLNALAGLTNLANLSLNNCGINNLSPLARLATLTELSLNQNPIADFSLIAGLTNLVSLTMESAQVSNANFVGSLSQLRNLDLAKNRLGNLSGLENLTRLLDLDVSYNHLTNMDALLNLSYGNFASSYNLYGNIDLEGNLLDFTFWGWPAPMAIAWNLESAGYNVEYQSQRQAPQLGVYQTNWTIAANATTAIPFSAGYDSGDGVQVSLSATSSDTLLLPDSGLTFGQAGYDNTLFITPASNRTGTASITLTVTDDAGLSSTTNIAVTVQQMALASFADPNLEAVVRYAVNKPVGALTLADLASLTYFYAPGSNITSIAGLEAATNLISVEIPFNSVTNLLPLANLQRLTYLDLANNQIHDVTALAGLSHLNSLSLGNNPLTDISALSGLTNLSDLSLQDIRADVCSTVSGLTNLWMLNLSGGSISNVQCLASLTRLGELYLDADNLSDVTPLANFTHLFRLSLNSNQVSNLDWVPSLTNLELLKLSYNPLTNCDALASITNLLSLELSGDALTNIDFIHGLKNLQSLVLDHNNLGNLDALTDMRISYLDASFNQLTNIDALRNVPTDYYVGRWYNLSSNLLDLTPGSASSDVLDHLLFESYYVQVVFQPQSPAMLPVVSITTGPLNNARLTNTIVTLGGTASGAVQLTAVEWQLSNNAGVTAWQTASGTTNWSLVANLAIGGNTISIRARDTANNLSPVVSRSIVLLTPLTITIEGCGSVSPDGAGTSFKETGKTYTITATPCPGYEFSAWTGGVGSSSATLSFTMQPGLVLDAHFVPAAFAPAAGVYTGLFCDTNGAVADSSGSVVLRTTAKGRFTGSLRNGRAHYPFSGKFDSNGRAQTTITRGKQSPFALLLQVDTTPGADLITGTVSDGDWTAALTADKAPFDARRNPAAQAGRYTMTIPVMSSPNSELLKLSAKDGHGLVTVVKSGQVRVAASLPDSTKFSQATLISRNGQWGLYVPLYTGRGMVLGWISIAHTEPNDVSGSLIWDRPELARNKPAFTIQTTVSGSPLTRSAAGQPTSASETQN